MSGPFKDLEDLYQTTESAMAMSRREDQQHCMCPACKHGILHYSDCAVHNMPAYPNGECDCGQLPEIPGFEGTMGFLDKLTSKG